MKKIFALVLAVAMLSSMAFAAGPVNGDGINLPNGTSVNPDSKIFLVHGDFFNKAVTPAVVLGVPAGEFTNANFAIAKRTFTKGLALVDTVTIDDDKEQVCIKLKQDLNLVAPGAGKAENLVIDAIAVKVKKDVKDNDGKVLARRNTTYTYDNSKGNRFKVGFSGADTLLSSPNYANGDLVKFKAVGSTNYAVASLSVGEFYMEGRVYDGDKIYTKVNFDANKDILKLYPDADLRFVNFTTSGLSSNNEVQISADSEEFVYEVVDKKIVKSSLKWNDDNYAFTGKINGNKTYVISDIELAAGTVAPGTEGTTNPETGANDVVGIAAALAVVSLVAAGAVSLKK